MSPGLSVSRLAYGGTPQLGYGARPGWGSGPMMNGGMGAPQGFFGSAGMPPMGGGGYGLGGPQYRPPQMTQQYGPPQGMYGGMPSAPPWASLYGGGGGYMPRQSAPLTLSMQGGGGGLSLPPWARQGGWGGGWGQDTDGYGSGRGWGQQPPASTAPPPAQPATPAPAPQDPMAAYGKIQNAYNGALAAAGGDTQNPAMVPWQEGLNQARANLGPAAPATTWQPPTALTDAMHQSDQAQGAALGNVGGNQADPNYGAFGQGQHDAFMNLVANYRAHPTMARGGAALGPVHFAEGGASLTPVNSFQRELRYAGEAGAGAAPSGLLHSAIAGRTDRLPMPVASGSYILPSDTVSGLGEGNTLAGARLISEMFGTGPFGIRPPHGSGHLQAPSPPRPSQSQPSAGFAKGGAAETEQPVPIVAAGGEVVLPPDVVRRIGSGDISRGHSILDKFVLKVRARTAKELRKLPGPKRD